ncbi:MAG: MmgE/PrpD family protein [Parvularculaceae bacterium]|jgi:2-methylcitrate dehydratase PrpD|nr:MmgE/PrpD family protein [Parvularculaceae bacterium]
MNASEAIVRHALSTPAGAIPASAVAAAKTFILDTIAVGVAGAKAPYAGEVLAAARRWGGAGVVGAAHAMGTGARLPAPSAAFVNGFQIHCQEFDCVHEGAVVHPMATILAAILAETESRSRPSGIDFIAAVVVAVDVAAGLGVAAKSPIRFFRPATAGLFGATLAVARLRRLDEARALDALGYALAHCSGTMQAHVEGKPALPVQIGNAARAAVYAADLAEAGLPGPRDVFDGPFGYPRLFETEYDLQPALASLGRVWRIEQVSHKPFPTGRAAQGGIAALQKLRADAVRAADVESVTLTAPPLIKRLVGRPYRDGMAASYARLCFPYCGAVALLKGSVGLADFTPAALGDPQTAEIARRIVVEEDGSSDPAAFVPQIARARLKDGREAASRIDSLPGSPQDPLPAAAQHDKVRACFTFGFGAPERGEALIAAVETLAEAADARPLARIAAGLEEEHV